MNFRKIALGLGLVLLCGNMFASTYTYTSTTTSLSADWLVSTTVAGTVTGGNSGACVLMTTDLSMRGMDVATTGNVLVVNQSAGKIFVCNGLDGTTTGLGYNGTGVLDNSIISGGTYTLCKVKVGDDGAIYACNMITAIATAALKVYRWADETSACTLAFTTTISSAISPRFGDSMGVIGNGSNTEIYLSGSASTAIMKLTSADGASYSINKFIPVTANWGSFDIDPVSVNGNLWTAGSSVGTILLNQSGVSQGQISSTIAETGRSGSVYGVFGNGRKVVLKVEGNTAAGTFYGRILDVTDGVASASYDFRTPVMGGNLQTGGRYGACAIDSVNNKVYFLLTNNSFGKFSLPATVPVELSGFAAE